MSFFGRTGRFRLSYTRLDIRVVANIDRWSAASGRALIGYTK